MPVYRDQLVLYELPIFRLELSLGGGITFGSVAALTNGRANYILFQGLVSYCTGLAAASEGGFSDLAEQHEVKAFHDAQLYPEKDLFQTSASSTFSANNHGPQIKALLEAGQYDAALKICRQTGYDKNRAYIYTNTRGFNPRVPFRYVIVPQALVLSLLSPSDPRLISRDAILARVQHRETIDPRTLQ